jgi:peptide/histidine transporter 3/4
MMAAEEEKCPADGREDYTQDGTVDLKGRPVLRSKTGGWRACFFIVGNVAYVFFSAFSLCIKQ